MMLGISMIGVAETMNLGLRSGGGIGDALEPAEY